MGTFSFLVECREENIYEITIATLLYGRGMPTLEDKVYATLAATRIASAMVAGGCRGRFIDHSSGVD